MLPWKNWKQWISYCHKQTTAKRALLSTHLFLRGAKAFHTNKPQSTNMQTNWNMSMLKKVRRPHPTNHSLICYHWLIRSSLTEQLVIKVRRQVVSMRVERHPGCTGQATLRGTHSTGVATPLPTVAAVTWRRESNKEVSYCVRGCNEVKWHHDHDFNIGLVLLRHARLFSPYIWK